MKYEKSKVVFTCCGKYIVPVSNLKAKTITCPSCGKKLTEGSSIPHIIIVKN